MAVGNLLREGARLAANLAVENLRGFMATRVTSPVFVGRRHELDHLASVLTRARDGRPAVVLVAGEAGVGKSRFVAEACDQARAAGMRVLEGGCVQVGMEGLPYGPLIEAFRALSHTVAPSELTELLGGARTDLARLMPHLVPGTTDPLD